ncbi:hypothetical protein BU15DRAFT_80719 [Melanogaster broomeanus]|nr:hypothetical protein BU15DRAFT_80719 [Melanogaster broomeanus]
MAEDEEHLTIGYLPLPLPSPASWPPFSEPHKPPFTIRPKLRKRRQTRRHNLNPTPPPTHWHPLSRPEPSLGAHQRTQIHDLIGPRLAPLLILRLIHVILLALLPYLAFLAPSVLPSGSIPVPKPPSTSTSIPKPRSSTPSPSPSTSTSPSAFSDRCPLSPSSDDSASDPSGDISPPGQGHLPSTTFSITRTAQSRVEEPQAHVVNVLLSVWRMEVNCARRWWRWAGLFVRVFR